jgi:predicted Fe-Mo cluster-binding NifX family protein
MKIAVISDDGINISQHFGRASLYVVVTVEDGKVVNKEQREKMGHRHFASSESHEQHEGKHGYGAEAQSRHSMMAQPISDCQVLIAGGMGMGAYEGMKSYNIETIVTDVSNIDDALRIYIDGKLVNLINRLH